MSFSVLMSVYHKDSPLHLREAFCSILSQELLPAQIVLVEDGPLSDDLQQEIIRFQQEFPNIHRVVIAKQSGLGNALRQGLLHCNCNIVARCDADDINKPQRFLLEYKFLKENPHIAVVGSQIEEFIENDNSITVVAKREVPLSHEEIIRFAQYRNPMNHMSVMFHKQAILEAGNYQDISGLEDYYLWLRVLQKGYHFANLAECLVSARVGKEMISRRGGFDYTQKMIVSKYSFWKEHLLPTTPFLLSSLASLFVGLCPSFLREKIYYQLLHKKTK